MVDGIRGKLKFMFKNTSNDKIVIKDVFQGS